jgi:copper chaperone CopZ
MKHILTSLFVAVTATFLSSPASAQIVDSVKTATIKVGNLHCNGDMPTIKKRLLNQDGIDDVAFTERDGEVSTFTVTYHSSVTNEPAIHKAIETTPGCDDKSETPYRVQRERNSKKKGS